MRGNTIWGTTNHTTNTCTTTHLTHNAKPHTIKLTNDSCVINRKILNFQK